METSHASPASGARPDASPALRIGAVAAVLFLSWLFLTQAWMVDDAYITLRTVRNFVDGHGLRWNVDERVQVFTHPLWTLLLAAFYAFTREAFATTLAISYGLLLSLLLVVHRRHAAAPWRFLLFAGMLVSSKAFFDYTSSGLENPLTSLLVAVFFGIFLTAPPVEEAARLRRLCALAFVAALAFVNRIDTILLFVPALAAEAFVLCRAAPWRTVRALLLGTLPATLWLLFALVYYGAPFPNTAYAKALSNGLGAAAGWQAGAAYFLNSLEWDPPTLVGIALAIALAIRKRRPAALLAMAGVLLYLLYVAKLGGIGTHMSGRFFSAPFLLAALIVLELLEERSEAIPVAALLGAFLFLSPGAPIRSQGSSNTLGEKGHGRSGLIDTRWFVHREGAALIRWERGTRWPNHGWHDEGRAFRAGKERVSVGGPGGGPPIGYFGYAVGPEKFVVDYLGLSDPLLARLPMQQGWKWWPGHFRRDVPEGYVESVRHGDNRLADPDLHAFYEKIRLITRGPLFSVDRFRAIRELHTGALQPLVDRYAARLAARRAPAPAQGAANVAER